MLREPILPPRTPSLLLVFVVALGVAPLAARAANVSSEVKCQRAIHDAGLTLVKTRAKQAARCAVSGLRKEDDGAAGCFPQPMTPTPAAKARRVRAVCTAELVPRVFAVCGARGGSCGAAVTDADGILRCLECTTAFQLGCLQALTFRSDAADPACFGPTALRLPGDATALPAVAASRADAKCAKVIDEATRRALTTTLRELNDCREGDPAGAACASRTVTLDRRKIDRACDAFDLAAIGYGGCPGTARCAADDDVSLDGLLRCLACVTEGVTNVTQAIEAPIACGNTAIDAGEQCDPAEATICPGTQTCVAPNDPGQCTCRGCGDGIVQPGEACDDGNLVNGDCCSSDCAVEQRGRPGADTCLRSVPLDVRETSQPGQMTFFNARPGGGSVGMPVGFGDVDGDGHGDFVACPMLADSGPDGTRHDAGEVHVYFGTGSIGGVVVNTPGATNLTTIMGARPGDMLGVKPEVVDLDADGFADVVVGAQNFDGLGGDRPNAGGVFVYRGRAGRPRTIDLAALPAGFTGLTTIAGAHPGDRLGIWVTSGDVDGDAHVDLLLGADQADGPDGTRMDAGAIYVIFGDQVLAPEIDLAAPGDLHFAVMHGIDPGDHLGSTVLAVDVDLDGDDDIAAAGGLARGSSQVGGTFMAGGDGPANDRPDAGEVHLLFSDGSFPTSRDLAAQPPSERLTVYGAQPSEVAGEELAAGDLDGDGLVDLAIGALQASGPEGPRSSRGAATGRTYLVFQAASRRGTAIDLDDPGAGVTTIYGRRKGGISGDTLIVVDMDGDGIDDLWDASPSYGTRDHAGTYRPASGVLDLLFGAPQWPATIDLLLPPDDLRTAQIRGGDTNDMFAYGLAVGDANADGYPDVIANAMAGDGVDNQAPDAGEFYVIDDQALFGTSGPRAPLYLNLDVQPIFEAACLPCHAGDDPAGALRLDVIQESILGLFGPDGDGRQSTQVGTLLVAPDAPDASYLFEKIDATMDHPPRVGDPMPPSAARHLPARVIGEIRQWIAGGAPIANETLPPPPPPPGPPAQGFATTFFTRMRLVLSDPALGEIESLLLTPPAAIPLRLIGPRLAVPHADFEPVTIPSGGFGDVQLEIREDGTGTIDRATGDVELALTLTQVALGGTVEIRLPVPLTTGAASGGPFASVGQPLDFGSGTLRLVGVGFIPFDQPVVGGDPVLVELEGSVAPGVPSVPSLTAEIQPIFDTSCAISNCHVGDGIAGLSLEPGRAYDELIGVDSTQVSGQLVVPGSPETSYLFEKISTEAPRVGDRMPIGNALDSLDVEAVRQWIAGGAPE